MLRGHALVGIVASAIVFVTTTAAHLVQPGVDPLRDPVSTLALGSGGPVVSAGFVVAGLACLALAVALHKAISLRQSWVPATLLGLGGICIAFLGAFTTDRTLRPTTLQGQVHFVLAGVGFLLLALSFVVYSEAFRRTIDWQGPNRVLRPVAWASLVAFLLTLALVVTALIGSGSLRLTGLLERLLIALMLGWTLLVSIRLLLIEKRPTARPIH